MAAPIANPAAMSAAQPTESTHTVINTASVESFAQTSRHPAFAESAANLTELLRGLVIRWETLDFSISANCFDFDDRMQAWHDAHAPETAADLLPRAYERQ